MKVSFQKAKWLTARFCHSWGTHPTFFELTTALAVNYFCQQEVEVLVMETGMGGSLDATNVLPTSVSVITPVDLDHQEWLGNNLESIAREKAGIIKPGVPVIISPCQNDAVLRVFDQCASKQQAPLRKVTTDDCHKQQKSSLKGSHQQMNAALAVAAVTTIWPDLTEAILHRGLRDLDWPGRFDIKAENMVIDGAHNPAATRALVSTWKEEFGNETRATIVFGAADSKEVSAMLTELAAIAQRFVFVRLSAKRGLELSALQSALTKSGAKSIPYSEAEDVNDALKQAKETVSPILVTGSLFLAGEALALCDNASICFETSEQ